MSLSQIKHICCGFICTALFITDAFAYTQQLIMAEPSSQQVPQSAPPQNSAPTSAGAPVASPESAPPVVQIPVPAQTSAEQQQVPQQPVQINPTQNSSIVAELITNPQPTTTPTNSAVEPTAANTNANNEPNSIIAPVAASQSDPNKAASSQYSDNEKQAWFKSCISGVTDKKMSGYAQEFCNCGWTHISSGQLPPDYFTNTSPDKIKQANSILRVISQQCLVDLRSSHNL